MHSLFCITHLPVIKIDLDCSATVVWLGPAGQKPQIDNPILDVHQASPDLMAWHPFLTGTSGTFAIRRFLHEQQQEFSDFDLITLTQYRKFVSRRQFGISAKNYPGLQIINENNQIPMYEEWFTKPEKYFLISQPIQIGSTLWQYSKAHQAPDLLRYLAIAVELEFITTQECQDLINHPVLIPGGIEFGTFPINIYLTLTEQLETICLSFLENHRPVKLDAYQRRALSFCNERLGSYLLQKLLHEIFGGTIPQEVIGHVHNIDINATEYRIGI